MKHFVAFFVHAVDVFSECQSIKMRTTKFKSMLSVWGGFVLLCIFILVFDLQGEKTLLRLCLYLPPNSNKLHPNNEKD